MLDLIFFTPGTTETDKEKIKDLYNKIKKSVFDQELIGKTIFFNNIKNEREFHILIEDNNQFNLKIEIEIESLYVEEKKYGEIKS